MAFKDDLIKPVTVREAKEVNVSKTTYNCLYLPRPIKVCVVYRLRLVFNFQIICERFYRIVTMPMKMFVNNC